MLKSSTIRIVLQRRYYAITITDPYPQSEDLHFNLLQFFHDAGGIPKALSFLRLRGATTGWPPRIEVVLQLPPPRTILNVRKCMLHVAAILILIILVSGRELPYPLWKIWRPRSPTGVQFGRYHHVGLLSLGEYHPANGVPGRLQTSGKRRMCLP